MLHLPTSCWIVHHAGFDLMNLIIIVLKNCRGPARTSARHLGAAGGYYLIVGSRFGVVFAFVRWVHHGPVHLRCPWDIQQRFIKFSVLIESP